MQHPDEGTIHAWLDGALSAAEARALEAHVAGCAQCAAAVTEARGLLAASSRILSGLVWVPGVVLPAAEPGASDDAPVVSIGRRLLWRSTGWRAAAAIVLVGSVSWLVTRSAPPVRDTGALAVPPAQSSAVANATAAEKPVAVMMDTVAAPAQPSPGLTRSPAKRAAERGRPDAAAMEAARPRSGETPPQVVAAAPSVMPYAPDARGTAPNAPVAALPAATGNVADRREQVAGAVAAERDAVASQLRAKVSAQSAGAAAGRTMLRASVAASTMTARPPVGCWLLDLNAAANAAPMIPRRIELAVDRDSTARATERDTRVVRAPAGAAPFAAGTRARWSMIGADSVLLEVSEATRSLVARLEAKGDSISGEATVSGAPVAGGSAVTAIRGVRVACPAQ